MQCEEQCKGFLSFFSLNVKKHFDLLILGYRKSFAIYQITSHRIHMILLNIKINILWAAKSYEEAFWDNGNVLYLNCDCGYIGIFLYQNSFCSTFKLGMVF